MLTGVYQSALIFGVVIVFYVMDTWLLQRYDPLRHQGSSRSWSYTLLALAAAVLIILQPTLWPGLGVHTEARWGLLIQALGLALILGALILHGWARIHLGQYYGEREEIQPGQQIIESGPYAHIRHPLYTSYFMIVTGLLLINPSLVTSLVAAYAFVDFGLATRREERLLVQKLPGYADYIERIPRFWPRIRNQQEAENHGP